MAEYDNKIVEVHKNVAGSIDQSGGDKLLSAMKLADSCVTKSYLSNLEAADIVPVDKSIEKITTNNVCRLFKISKIGCDKNENVQDKLLSVLNTVSSFNSSVVLVIDSDGENADYYMGIANTRDLNSVAVSYATLKGAFEGNFPGSEIQNLDARKLQNLTDGILSDDRYAISSVSGIASLRNDKENSSEGYIQGMEKLFESMRGKPFAAVIIADSVSSSSLNEVRAGYESLYSQIAPFEKSELTFNASDTYSVSSALTESISDTVSKSVGLTNNYSESATTNNTVGTSSSKSTNAGGVVGSVIGSAAGITGLALGGPAGAFIAGQIGSSIGSVASGVIGTDTKGESFSKSQGENITKGTAQQTTEGTTKTMGYSKGETETGSYTTGRTLHLTYENRSVKTLLEAIDEQIERLKQCEDFGLFNCAAYFISGDSATSKVAANTYRALMRGENSSSECSHINTWSERKTVGEINKYLKKMMHPVFNFKKYNSSMPYVTAGSLVSGKELSVQMGLPKKSLPGLPVIRYTEFSRNIIKYKNSDGRKTISIGRIFHMGKIQNSPVCLTVDDFTKHAFVTGSTGSGKSNTVYVLLDRLSKSGAKFMVVEPAKGEYKNVFGGREDVNVVGTNINYSPVLHINPFKFPEGIHVLEHTDRIIEMFNACWPMYAAMPAILKEAVETAYVNSGWDLDESTNLNSELKYPTFSDVLKVLPGIINETEYSGEVKGNYTGSLVTRVKTMTNGIYGRIFCEDETDNKMLFDSNMIIDLSRIGSVEAKSLIMGVLVMRLQEHRMANSSGMNSGLKHITVLEEAHHLLKRTSSVQSDEGSNLQGKSVEMISNAIAEMRTYGEGFIIADQSPGLLDMSVIRNTNTKIILKLPDKDDRIVVGKAAGLTDEQIEELTRLETGVAAISESSWVSPVLCKIDEFPKSSERKLVYKRAAGDDKSTSRNDLGKIVSLILSRRVKDKISIDDGELSEIRARLDKSKDKKLIAVIDEYETKHSIHEWDKSGFTDLLNIICEIYDSKKLIRSCSCAEDLDAWIEMSHAYVNSISKTGSYAVDNEVTGCLLIKEANEDEEVRKFYYRWFYKVNEK